MVTANLVFVTAACMARCARGSGVYGSDVCAQRVAGTRNLTTPPELKGYLLDPAWYKRDSTPHEHDGTGSTVAATVQMDLAQIAGVDQKTQEFTVVGFVKLSWTDKRLCFAVPAEGGGGGALREGLLDLTESQDRLWLPDWYIDNARSPVQTAKDLLEVSHTGQISWRILITATLECRMNFAHLPWDNQTCPIVFMSYSQQSSLVNFTFSRDEEDAEVPLVYTGEEQLSEWKVSVGTSWIDMVPFSGGVVWCVVRMHLVITRSGEFYWNEYLRPSVLFVIINYCSFWIDRKQSAPRVTVALLPILFTVERKTAMQALLPPIPYTSWLQEYMTGMLAFQAFGMLIYVVILTLHRCEEKRLQRVLQSSTWRNAVAGRKRRISLNFHRNNTNADALGFAAGSRLSTESEADAEATLIGKPASERGSPETTFEAGGNDLVPPVRVDSLDFLDAVGSTWSVPPPLWAIGNFSSAKVDVVLQVFAETAEGGSAQGLNADELVVAFQLLGMSDVTDPVAKYLVSRLDSHGQGCIDLNTFLWLALVVVNEAELRSDRKCLAWCRFQIQALRFQLLQRVVVPAKHTKLSQMVEHSMRVLYPFAFALFNTVMFVTANRQ